MYQGHFVNDTFKANNMSLGFGIVVLFLYIFILFYFFFFLRRASERFAVTFSSVSYISRIVVVGWLSSFHSIYMFAWFPFCPSGPL